MIITIHYILFKLNSNLLLSEYALEDYLMATNPSLKIQDINDITTRTIVEEIKIESDFGNLEFVN
jgi:hypothetical protein